MSSHKATLNVFLLLCVMFLAACSPQEQKVPQKFPSAWDFEAYGEGTSFEDRIAWVHAETGYPKERLFLDTRAPEGRLEREPLPVLRMSKPYGCEVDSIDVAVDKQVFEVAIWDHYTDVIITPAFIDARESGKNATAERYYESWESAPFWHAFRSGAKLALKLSWDCDYPQALPAQTATLATFSLTGADYALHYVMGGSS